MFCSGFGVQTAVLEAAEAEAAAEGIGGAENNNRDKRPEAPRFHLFVYRVSRRLFNKVPSEISGVSRDVTAPPPGGCGGTGTESRRHMILMCELVPQRFGSASCGEAADTIRDRRRREQTPSSHNPPGFSSFLLFFPLH